MLVGWLILTLTAIFQHLVIAAPERKVLVVGSVNADVIIPIENMPILGETIVALEKESTGRTVAGGKGANQAVSCSRLGASVSFFCQFGNDSNGQMLENVLKENNVDTSLSVLSHKSSGLGLVFLHEHGDVSCVVVGGANAAWPENFDFEQTLKKNKGIACILLQMEIPQRINEIIAAAAYKYGIPVIQDIGGAESEISQAHYQHCTFISPNLSELERLSKLPVTTEAEIIAAAKSLQKKGARNVLVTLGSNGSLLLTERGQLIKQARCHVDNVVDETGAGDNYRAAFAVAHFVEKKSLRESMAFAAAAGAVAVTKLGAIPACATREECLSLIKKNMNIRGGHSEPNKNSVSSDSSSGSGVSDGSEISKGKASNGKFPLRFASRLNSMKDRKDLWVGTDDVFGWIRRQGQVEGLDYVDFNYPQHLPFLPSNEEFKSEICSALKDAGLSCGAVCLRYPKSMQLGALTNPDRNLREEAIRLTKEACEWALALGANEVVVWSAFDGYDYSLQVNHHDLWDKVVAAFQEICDDFPSVKVSLEYKPTDENTRYFTVPSTGAAVLLMKEIDRPNFGLTLDFGHCLMAGENPAQSVALVSRYGGGIEGCNKLFGVQLGDGYGRLGAEDGLAFGSVHPTAALEFVLWLLKTGFNGHIYFDTFPRNEDPVRECAFNIRQFKKFYRLAETLLASGEHAETVRSCWERHDAMTILELLEKINNPSNL